MKFKFEIKWGVLFTLFALLWMAFEKAMGWHDTHIDQHATYTNFFAFIAILVYVLAFLDKRKNVKGQMKWKHGFFFGLGIAVVVAILSPLSQWIVSAFISPDYFQNAIEYAVGNGKMTQIDAEAYFNLESYMVQASIGALVMGAVTSAIVALFIRKKTSEYLG